MRFGVLEIVLIVAVLLSIAVIWRWWHQYQPGDEADEDEAGDGAVPSLLQRLSRVGVLLILGGVGLLIISYIFLVGLAKTFIFAVVFLLLGIAFLVLSRR